MTEVSSDVVREIRPYTFNFKLDSEAQMEALAEMRELIAEKITLQDRLESEKQDWNDTKKALTGAIQDVEDRLAVLNQQVETGIGQATVHATKEINYKTRKVSVKFKGKKIAEEEIPEDHVANHPMFDESEGASLVVDNT